MSQAVYALLRSLLNERHWRSARECAEAHSYLKGVVDDERFYDTFDWNPEGGGFAPLKKVTADSSKETEAVTGAHKINVLVACGQTCKTVPKISSIYYFAPGAHTEGDGYLYQNRSLSDVFVFPNGKDGKIDSIFVDVDTTEYTEG